MKKPTEPAKHEMPTDAERRIERIEKALAQEQTETAYQQIQANLVKERLRSTLDTAMAALSRMSLGIEMNIQHMADELNGNGHGNGHGSGNGNKNGSEGRNQ